MSEVISVGQLINARRIYHQVPPGTVMEDSRNSANRYIKSESGDWYAERERRSYSASAFSVHSRNRIVSFPDGATQYNAPQPTVAQVKHRFRTGALAEANQHGVSYGAVEEALREMGAGPDAALPFGAGVTVHTGDTDSLPAGTTVFVGDPGNPATFGVFRWTGRTWKHLLGDRAYIEQRASVVGVNDDLTRPAWLDETGTDEDKAAIAEFKAAAWRIGWKLKRAQGWCGTYEEIVRGLGVSEADLRAARYGGFDRGQRVTVDEAANLPIGSVLTWTHSSDPDRYAVFVRTGNAQNRAGTVRVGASPAQQERDHENAKRYMVVGGVFHDDEHGSDWEIVGPTNPWLALLPAGTVFTFSENNQRYQIQQDRSVNVAGRPVGEQGPWQFVSFSGNTRFIIYSIPTEV